MAHGHGLLELFGLATSQLSSDERRALRADAWREVVRCAARRRRVLLVFSDLDRLDGPSRELVAALAALGPSTRHPVHVIVTHDPNLMLLWPETEAITVQALSQAHALELTRQLLDSVGSDADPAAIATSSHGLPLMLIELVRLYLLDPAATLPRTLPEVISQRIDHLPPRARNLLHALAVAGRTSSSETLMALIEEKAAEIASLNLLAEQGFLTLASGGWRLAHRVHRDIAYATTPAAVRVRLHRQAAKLAIDSGEPPSHAAYHLFEAGDHEAAVPYLLLAGWRALDVLDDVVAARQFHRALQVVPRPPARFNGKSQPWVSANEGLSAALADGGDRRGALELIRGAAKAASDAGWSDECGRLERHHGRLLAEVSA